MGNIGEEQPEIEVLPAAPSREPAQQPQHVPQHQPQHAPERPSEPRVPAPA